MAKEPTFKDVFSFIKDTDSNLIDNVDKFLSVIIIISPIIFGPEALPALGLLAAKSELTNIGRDLFKVVTRRKETDFLTRIQKMETAYGLICLTSFFDAFDRLIDEKVRKQIHDAKFIPKPMSNRNNRENSEKSKEFRDTQDIQGGFLESVPPFPHPASSFFELSGELRQFYNQMANRLAESLLQFGIPQEKDESTKSLFNKLIMQLPDEAVKQFEAEYFELARKNQDFFVWSQIQNMKGFLKISKDSPKHLVQNATFAVESAKKIDIGFTELQRTVNSIPEKFEAIEAERVLEGLRRHYEARLNEPIIEDKYEEEKNKPSLIFPKLSEAFIPQSIRVLRYTARDTRLTEDTWKQLKTRNDLGPFLLSYLDSPQSVTTPLLILGHPGSGKSILTQTLCARLMSQAFIPIRVPLRETNAEDPIDNQIENEIRRITGYNIRSWATFSHQFNKRPLVIFLDGYDELLQASGKVFAGYLRNVQSFQDREAEQGRPVRIIITSRITLIDKATIPEGSTIVQLVEFNEEQRKAWIDVWNNTNSMYFKSNDPPIQPFDIPKEKKILELSEQPLLLLMLAIYDSIDNSLRKSTDLDRTELYNSLLRRFVRREKNKITSFRDDLQEKDQNIQIDREISRLGVAAIGMYNRRKLHIKAEELSDDLRFFGLDIQSFNTSGGGRQLTPADVLLGSFFFVHKSLARQEADVELANQDTAFEFLHNTFGEFLTADFILRFAFQETEALRTLKLNESLIAELRRKLSSPDGLVKEWFACLMYAPLYSRPVVLEMLREWANHILQEKKQSRDEFLSSLDEIVHSQVGMMLNTLSVPSITRVAESANYPTLPLLGHIAIYTLNLVILRTILDEKPFVFNEERFIVTVDERDTESLGARPWDRLAHLWKSWFTLDNLIGLADVFVANRDSSEIVIETTKLQKTSGRGDKLSGTLKLASALADNVTIGLASWYSAESITPIADKVQKCLESEGIQVRFELIVRRLREMFLQLVPSHYFIELIIAGIRELSRNPQVETLKVEFLDLVTRAVETERISGRYREILMREIDNLYQRNTMDYYLDYPVVLLGVLKLINAFNSSGNRRKKDRIDITRYLTRTSVEQYMYRPDLSVMFIRLIYSMDRQLSTRIWRDFVEDRSDPIMDFVKSVEYDPEMLVVKTRRW